MAKRIPTHRLLATLVFGLAAALQGAALAQAPAANAANLAMVGEPPSLDPMQATTDLVGTIIDRKSVV